MANLAELVTSKQRPASATDDAGDAIRESRYAVPPFWLAAFDATCVEQFWDDEEEMAIPVLVSTRSDALYRLPKRLDTIQTDFQIPPHYCSMWIDLVSKLNDPFLICLVEEIVFMDDDGVSDLIPSLDYFDESTERTLDSMLRLSDLSDTLDERRLVERAASSMRPSTLERLIGYQA